MSDKIKTKDGEYSELQVMQSNAGFYIGRIFTGNDGLQEPGSRESDYFASKALAEQALKEGFIWRDAPENLMLYEKNN
jgi:hypothetical protein